MQTLLQKYKLYVYLFSLLFFFEGNGEEGGSIPKRPFLQRVTIAHQEGINAYSGFGTNYTSASLFFSQKYQAGKAYPFLDGRVHRFDNHTYSANLGAGFRFIPSGERVCHILGASVSYDYRRGHNWNYNQIGLGLEALGRLFDARLNIYIPFGKKKYSNCSVFDQYEGNWYAKHCRCESVSYGLNGEMGWTIGEIQGIIFYAATGPYYFSKKCLDHSLGWELRFHPQYKDFFGIDLKVHYDKLYQMVYQTTFTLSLPLYEIGLNKSKPKPCGLSPRQIYQPLVRIETMPIQRKSTWTSNF